MDGLRLSETAKKPTELYNGRRTGLLYDRRTALIEPGLAHD